MLKTKYFLCYCELLIMVLFNGKGGSNGLYFSDKTVLFCLISQVACAVVNLDSNVILQSVKQVM